MEGPHGDPIMSCFYLQEKGKSTSVGLLGEEVVFLEMEASIKHLGQTLS